MRAAIATEFSFQPRTPAVLEANRYASLKKGVWQIGEFLRHAKKAIFCREWVRSPKELYEHSIPKPIAYQKTPPEKRPETRAAPTAAAKGSDGKTSATKSLAASLARFASAALNALDPLRPLRKTTMQDGAQSNGGCWEKEVEDLYL